MRHAALPAAKTLACAIACLMSGVALADTTLPGGGTVAAGSASIGTSGAAMTVTQSSQRAVINWNSFSIGNQASVTFAQPNSTAVALNRVLGTDLSRIDGQLNANGQVFISNPNGVIFGTGSQVNVGGLVATTLDLDDTQFMAGTYTLAGSSQMPVINAGTITAGNVGLVGARVINSGTITTDGGSTVLAAGERVTLSFDGSGLLAASVDSKVLAGLVQNGGVIDVGSGRLLMTAGAADALGLTVVNNSGVARATSLTGQGGEIILQGDAVSSFGTLDASGATGGGSVSMEGNVAVHGGTLAANGTGGSVTITAPISVDPANVDPAVLLSQINTYAAANPTATWAPIVSQMLSSNAVNVQALLAAVGSPAMAAFLAGDVSDASLKQVVSTLLSSGAVDLKVLASSLSNQQIIDLLNAVPVSSPYKTTVQNLLASGAINIPVLLNVVASQDLVALASGTPTHAQMVSILNSLMTSGAINLQALVAAVDPAQLSSLLGAVPAGSNSMLPLLSPLLNSGAVDLGKLVGALSAEQIVGLLDGTINQSNMQSLLMTVMASGAIDLKNPAVMGLLASLGGQLPAVTPPKPVVTPAPTPRMTFQQRLQMMMAQMRARIQAMMAQMQARMRHRSV